MGEGADSDEWRSAKEYRFWRPHRQGRARRRRRTARRVRAASVRAATVIAAGFGAGTDRARPWSEDRNSPAIQTHPSGEMSVRAELPRQVQRSHSRPPSTPRRGMLRGGRGEGEGACPGARRVTGLDLGPRYLVNIIMIMRHCSQTQNPAPIGSFEPVRHAPTDPHPQSPGMPSRGRGIAIAIPAARPYAWCPWVASRSGKVTP